MIDQKTDLIKRADDLLARIKKANRDFGKRTSKIISDVDKLSEGLDEMNLDKELGKVEKESVKEMDAAVLDFLSEE